MHRLMQNPLTKLSESTEEDEVLRSRKRKLDMEAESDSEQLREQLRLHLEDKRILNGDAGKRLRRDFGRLLKSGEEGVPMADIDYEIYKYINELADQYIELDDLLEQNGVSYSEALEQAAQFRKQFLCLLEKHAVRNQDLVVICWDLMERIEQLTMAKKAKGNRVQVILECTEHKDSGMPGTSRYITTKNRKNTTERLELKKYNPILKRVTVHKEIK